MSRRIEPCWQCSRNEPGTRDMPKPIPSAEPDHPARISIGALDMVGSTINYFCGAICDTHKPVRSHHESSRSLGNQPDIDCRSLGPLHRDANGFEELSKAPRRRDPRD